MEQAKRRKVEMIAGLVLIVLAFVGNCHVLFANALKSDDGVGLFGAIFVLLALIMAGVYVGTGFKKSSAKIYKLFLYVFALKQLTGILCTIQIFPAFVKISTIIMFVLLNVLLWVDDLGKMKSIVLSSLVFAESLFMSIYLCIVAPLSFEGIVIYFAHVALSLVLVMMVHMKYVDKEMRKGKNN